MAFDLLQRHAPGTLVENETFTDVEGVALAGLEVFSCRFESCRFGEQRWSRVVLERCTFVDCDLTKLSWGGSSLRGVTFENCKLLGVEFAGAADNPEFTCSGCSLRYAVFDGVNVRGARFVDCSLQDASFVECDLQDASFDGCDLGGATLRRCRLAGADFSTATGLFFEPAQNQSKDVYLSEETAVQLARAQGMRVAGYDERVTTTKRKRR
jgi:fluoroquinolone resistance protein